MKILGIETSCDETAAAIVEDGKVVLSNVIATSVNLHAQTGGVVPEVAAREHLRQILPVLDQAFADAKTEWGGVDAIAVTHAPGLLASLRVGVSTAQTLSFIHGKPLIPTHHVAGHIYANFLERATPIRFPIVVLTVSGGHNELVLLKGHHEFEVLGETLDDAAGEAFDKVARLLDLGFPGGPAISRAAEKGNSQAFPFPRAHLSNGRRYDFSFSGLKTAVRNTVQKLQKANPQTLADLAASFQWAVIDELSEKFVQAARDHGAVEAHLAGGVSANRLLRTMAEEKLRGEIPLVCPQKMIYCTDNAAMIAGAAYFLVQRHPAVLKEAGRHVEIHSQLSLPDEFKG